MSRHVLAVDLRDDASVIAAYEAHHREVWPEVISSLRAAGIDDMEILVLGRRLVMIVETARELDAVFAGHVATGARVAQWEALMKSMQEPAPGGAPGEWWAVMRPIFSLSAAERCSA